MLVTIYLTIFITDFAAAVKKMVDGKIAP